MGCAPRVGAARGGGSSARLLVARLRAAVARAGLQRRRRRDGGAPATTPPARSTRCSQALEGESCAIVIDDAHHADRERGRADRADRRAARPRRNGWSCSPGICRRAPSGCAAPARCSSAPSELALSPDETLELCRTGFGLEVDRRRRAAARRGHRRLDGRGRARRLARQSHRPAAPDASRIAGVASADAVRSMLDEVLAASALDRRLAAQLGACRCSTASCWRCSAASAEFFERVLELGLPISRRRRRLVGAARPGPRRARRRSATPTATRSPRPPPTTSAAASSAPRSRCCSAPASTRRRHELLADAEPREIEAIEALELLSVVDRIPPSVLDRFPRAILTRRRSCHAANLLRQRARLLERLARRRSATTPSCDARSTPSGRSTSAPTAPPRQRPRRSPGGCSTAQPRASS